MQGWAVGVRQGSTGLQLNNEQLEQISFAVSSGGLGLRSSIEIADAAYLGSRAALQELGRNLMSTFSFDGDTDGTFVHAALDRCNRALQASGMSSRVSPEADGIKQSGVSKLLNEARLRTWRGRASADDVCRLNAYSAPHAGKVFDVTPTETIDKVITRSQFVTEVANRLGVDVDVGGHSCGFCGMVVDCKGRHSMSCMAGGDTTALHNTVRDLVFDYCKRGNLQAEEEAPGILKDLATPEGRRRPADVLVCNGVRLLDRLPDGSQQTSFRRVALDFAVINALGQGHTDDTFREAGGAAEAYSERKRRHLGTARKCREVGVAFVPMVLEAQGGMSRATSGILRKISEAVAEVEHSEAASIREDLLQRLALVRARANASAIARRRVVRQASVDQAVAQFEAATAHLEEPA